jgi:TRAP transporter TAXI family solute receptor
VGMVVGAPSLNQNAFAVLAFGNLTRNDVKLVEFSSYGAMWKGILNNEVDAAIASTISGQAREAEASPRGLYYPPTPAADKAGWERLRRSGPYYAPHKATCGVGLSKENPAELPNYPYPIVTAYASQSAELVHGIVAGMIATYPAYKDAAPGADGFELSRQDLTWVLPYHEGTVRAFKEAGVWKAEHEAHNQALLKRQQVLAEAWNAYLKTNPADDKAAFSKGWLAARAAALRKASLPTVFD